MTQIIAATFQDLPRLAQCHRSAFPRALSSVMGQKYVEKMLEWYLVDKRAFIFFVEEDHKCVGYCGGLKFDGTERVGSASSMIQHSYHQAVRTFLTKPWLFFHPEFIPKYKLAAKNVWRRIKKALRIAEKVKPEPRELPSPHTGLIVIGVNPDAQRKGYGSMLLQEFERITIGLGYRKMMLTVKTDNKQAINSYLRNGWLITLVEANSTTMEKQL